MIDIKKHLEEKGEVNKFSNIAPDGFVLVHEQTLKDLEDYDIWRQWRNKIITTQDLNKLNFKEH